MRSIAFVLATFVASAPAAAQGWKEYSYPDYAFSVAFPAKPQVDTTNKNFAECMKELGLPADAGNPYKLSVFRTEAQEAAFSDCVTRKALRPR